MRGFLSVLTLLLLVACNAAPEPAPEAFLPATPPAVGAAIATATPRPAPPTLTPLPPTESPLPPSATATRRPSATPPPTNTALPPSETPLPPSETPLPPTATTVPPNATAADPVGVVCARPADDYERVTVRGHTLSRRTYGMLENAQGLYGGRGSMFLLIQGSYDPGLGASFGTHDGGGAVDIWVVDPDDRSRIVDDVEAMVIALRQSGFAAWFRPANMLYQGMFPHIHAIAIGDADLSPAARAQIESATGYLAGQNGLPDPPHAGPDPHGGPIVCGWMASFGYAPAASPGACERPPDLYERVELDGHWLNRRTLVMLERAQAIYGGPGNLLWITQGSYTNGVSESFGTHDGGGVVDISIRHPQTFEFLYDDADAMVRALREAGFAAWYRSPREGFVPHIHAVAIGDADLSPAAREQIVGPHGYFAGQNGLPPETGYAGPDPHGGPIRCGWMDELEGPNQEAGS